MKENKYFTPSIEDIRVGYECERLEKVHDSFTTSSLKDEWKKYEISWPLDLKNLRVPYLTKEQIEAEGWEYSIFNFYFKIINGIEVRLYLHNDNYIGITSNGSYVYEGECKDINTFRYICKLLNIK